MLRQMSLASGFSLHESCTEVRVHFGDLLHFLRFLDGKSSFHGHLVRYTHPLWRPYDSWLEELSVHVCCAVTPFRIHGLLFQLTHMPARIRPTDRRMVPTVVRNNIRS